jgi:hypothetical protein
MAGVREVLAQLLEHADHRLPSGFYLAISVPTERVRSKLRRSRRAFIDPGEAAPPELADVDATATWVISQASLSGAMLGGFASVAGAASVPPEALATAVAWVRLAQRLAIVYGFDPETERGQLAVWRALAAGLELQMPDHGPLSMRVRDLPTMILPRATMVSASAEMARAVLRQSLWSLATRVTRLVPIVSPGVSAVSARRRVSDVGERMKAALRRLAEVPGDLDVVEDAVEVR